MRKKHKLFQVVEGQDIYMSEHVSIDVAKGRARCAINHGGQKKIYVVVDGNTSKRFLFKSS